MKIILTRHGRTVENDAGILQGHLPGKLNEKGIIQAQKVAIRLQDEHIDYMYSSDLDRAADTTREILKYHPDVPVEFIQELREIFLWEWQGKTKQELGLVNNPEADTLGPSDGETPEAIVVRAKAFLDRIREKHPNDTVLLVAHNGINRRLVWVLTGQKSVEIIRNTSVSVFEIDEYGNVDVQLFNCCKHLEE